MNGSERTILGRRALLAAGAAGVAAATSSVGVYIQAAVAKPAEGRITIYLNKKATVATRVAYLVLQTD